MLEYFGRKEKGFTLMELLIAVAIVVILSGVGIPVYLKFMGSTKHSEASANLSSIKLTENSYKLSSGVYASATVAPRAIPDGDAVGWLTGVVAGAAPAPTAGVAEFNVMDFSLSGDVRFVYAITAVNAGGVSSFDAAAQGDTDGDGKMVLFQATQDSSPIVVGADGTTVAGLTGDTSD